MKLIQDAHLGANIKKLRLQRNLTQVQVVALLQIRGSKLSETAYSKLEGGHRNLYVTDLMRLKDIFAIDFGDFFVDLSVPVES